VTPGLVDIHVQSTPERASADSYAGDNSLLSDGFTLRAGVDTIVDADLPAGGVPTISSSASSIGPGRACWRSQHRGTHASDKFEQNLADMEAAHGGHGGSAQRPDVGIKTAPCRPEWAPVERAVEAGTRRHSIHGGFWKQPPERPMAELVTRSCAGHLPHAYSGFARLTSLPREPVCGRRSVSDFRRRP